jgi:hypothetical protein
LLDADETRLLSDVLAKRRPELLAFPQREADLSGRRGKDRGCNRRRGGSDCWRGSWDQDSYGSRLERLLDAVNRHLLP